MFGRARPATGFAVDITAISKLGLLKKIGIPAVAVIESSDANQWQAIQNLREQGQRVVAVGDGANLVELGCDRQLLFQDGCYQVVAL